MIPVVPDQIRDAEIITARTKLIELMNGYKSTVDIGYNGEIFSLLKTLYIFSDYEYLLSLAESRLPSVIRALISIYERMGYRELILKNYLTRDMIELAPYPVIAEYIEYCGIVNLPEILIMIAEHEISKTPAKIDSDIIIDLQLYGYGIGIIDTLHGLFDAANIEYPIWDYKTTYKTVSVTFDTWLSK